MAIGDKHLNTITEADLLELVSDGAPESKTLEFKRQLPGRTDGEKKEFLCDVSSFANALGGDLIYGISETNGQAQELVGARIENPDGETLRLENLIRDGIEPRIPGLQVHCLPLSDARYAFLIRVPRSWTGPHCVKVDRSFRFYSRNAAGKYPVDYGELRSLFALSDSRVERLRQFRTERLGRIIAGDTPVLLEETPKAVLHVLPWSAFDPGAAITKQDSKGPSDAWIPLASDSFNKITHNFDGMYSNYHSAREGYSSSYLQLFRNGCIETVTADLTSERENEKLFYATLFEKGVIEALKRFQILQQHFGIEPPLVIMISLLGLKGYEIVELRRRFNPTRIDRNELIVSEVVVEDFNYEPDQVMRHAFDTIWNAAGGRQSMSYDEQGQWKNQ